MSGDAQEDASLDALISDWMKENDVVIDYGIIAGSTNQEIWQAEFDKVRHAAEIAAWHKGHCRHDDFDRPHCLRKQMQHLMDEVKPAKYAEFFDEFRKFVKRQKKEG